MLPSFFVEKRGSSGPMSPSRVNSKVLKFNAKQRARSDKKYYKRRLWIATLAVVALSAHIIGTNIVGPLTSHGRQQHSPGRTHLQLHTSAELTTITNSQGQEVQRQTYTGTSSVTLLTDSAAAASSYDLLQQVANAATRAASTSAGNSEALLIHSDREGLDGLGSATDIAANALNTPPPPGTKSKRKRPLNELYKDICPPPSNNKNKVVVDGTGQTGHRLSWSFFGSSSSSSKQSAAADPNQQQPEEPSHIMSSKSWVRQYGSAVPQYSWCKGAPDKALPDLHPAALLRSNKVRPTPGLTVVTQLSLERLRMLETQCRLWPNQIAAVVYIPLQRGKVFSAEEPEQWHMKPLYMGMAAIKKLHATAEEDPNGCVLDLEVVVEERCFREPATLYPANAVRNRALMLAQTDAVLLLDADFVVSTALARQAANPFQFAALISMLRNNTAMVLPAFEPRDNAEVGKSIAMDSVVQGKDYIVDVFKKDQVYGFHMDHYHQGHGKTNHWKWANTTQPYTIDYQIGFEPYVLMARKAVPWYDERFRGYYWNKVCHLMHIAFQNRFSFVVHPEAFVVHVPHKTPPTKWRTRASGQKEKNYKLFNEAITDMKRGRFVPVTSFPHLCVPPEVAAAATAAALDGRLEELVASAYSNSNNNGGGGGAMVGAATGSSMNNLARKELPFASSSSLGEEEGSSSSLHAGSITPLIVDDDDDEEEVDPAQLAKEMDAELKSGHDEEVVVMGGGSDVDGEVMSSNNKSSNDNSSSSNSSLPKLSGASDASLHIKADNSDSNSNIRNNDVAAQQQQQVEEGERDLDVMEQEANWQQKQQNVEDDEDEDYETLNEEDYETMVEEEEEVVDEEEEESKMWREAEEETNLVFAKKTRKVLLRGEDGGGKSSN